MKLFDVKGIEDVIYFSGLTHRFLSVDWSQLRPSLEHQEITLRPTLMIVDGTTCCAYQTRRTCGKAPGTLKFDC